ncbi:MAG: hypothetical protein ACUVXJ_06120, partial [Phycisphaerae bacterium]
LSSYHVESPAVTFRLHPSTNSSAFLRHSDLIICHRPVIGFSALVIPDTANTQELEDYFPVPLFACSVERPSCYLPDKTGGDAARPLVSAAPARDL